jgi:antitoxin (DNA-binding transcriptional repressor) of toxin-antitoxin stability system
MTSSRYAEGRPNMTVTLEDAQRRLPELLLSLPPDQPLVIEHAGQPLATVTRIPRPNEPRRPGSAKDKIFWMAPDFDAPLEEFREYME